MAGPRWLAPTSAALTFLAACGQVTKVDNARTTDGGLVADSMPVAPVDAIGRWVWQSDLPSSTDLRAVWVASPDEAWAVGGLTTLHYSHGSWSLVASGTMNDLDAVWGASANDVWAVAGGWAGDGNFATLTHWDGSAWSPVAAPTAMNLSCVWGRGANDVWAAGESGVAGAIIHFDGHAWTTEFASDTFGPLVLHGDAAGDVWAAGEKIGPAEDDAFALRRGADGQWTPVSTGTHQLLSGVWTSDAGDAWAVGYDTRPAIHWDGNGWTPVSGPGTSLTAVWGASRDDVWAVGQSILHWDGAAWTSAAYRGPTLAAIHGSDASHIWAVGDHAAIFRFDPSSADPPTCADVGGRCVDAAACAPGDGHETDHACGADAVVCCVSPLACGGDTEPACCTDGGDHPRPACLDGSFVCPPGSTFCPLPP